MVNFLTATSVIASVELNRATHDPLAVGSASQPRVLDGASCSMANNSPDGGECMQGLAEIFSPLSGIEQPATTRGLPLGCRAH